jgi:DNA-binding XRE family transcriptional regulator
VAQAEKAARPKPRNARVHAIDRDSWRRERKVRFNRAVNFAAAAKSTRTALQVTQAEVAAYLDLSVTAILQRENGFHAWTGGARQLAEYQRACMKIAGH